MQVPTQKELEAAYQEASRIYKEHLIHDGVKMPKWNTASGYWLAILIHFKPQKIHKDHISDIVRKYVNVASDQQVRHLKRYGWNLEGTGGFHCIKDPYKAHSGYTRQLRRQGSKLTAKTFKDICVNYGNRCATCGARAGEPDPRYGDNNVKLQQGHMDPEKATNLANIIPQCQYCNRAYKDDFTFDDKGRVRAVASERPVLRASNEVKNKIRNILNNQKKSL